ncbi:hypothetical protein NQ156_02990 [Microbacterium sp. zg.Y625]|uniref:hypothetical protein n=1 Tax=Microbacterium jiangjiandongii TaxID=3049071 RepID=UPI00214B9071|nr:MULTISPECIES: hypothetical protein [unclassified Microbacterium]MCR2792021.1 hypothetical protein [Microbacterium sp. zg.Y625]WIM24828.1 hypothetical protein QNO14_11900 [Microbacterium sp. zg-Y625]
MSATPPHGTAPPTPHRDDPLTDAMARTDLARRRGRWAAAFGSAALALGMGGFFFGAPSSPEREHMAGGAAIALAWGALGIIGVALGALAVLFALGALSTGGIRIRWATATRWALVGAAALIALLLASPILLTLAVPLAVVFALVAPPGSADPPASLRTRALWGSTFAVAALALVALTVAHVTVWNPLARVPGMGVERIYAEMIAANQLSLRIDPILVAWAALWVFVALGVVVASLVPAIGDRLTARRLVVAGCALLGLIGTTGWIAGFNIGMALADTFLTSGADAAPVGPALRLVGQVFLVAALIIGLAPSRATAPRPAPVG